MANLGISFNATQHDTESQGTFEDLPAGIYRMEIEASEVKENSSGTGTILKTTARVIEPEDYEGRKLFDNFNLQHDNPKAQEIGQAEFAKLCRSLEMSNVEDSEELHFKGFTVKVGLGKPSKEKDSDGNPKYPARAEIKRYYYPDQGNVPEPEVDGGAQSSQSKPAANDNAKPAAQAQNKSAQKSNSGNGKSRPWG